jgi:formate hydrogenlyase subunit 3/multisubunit Na+/H+ antiporter MnhD subunit
MSWLLAGFGIWLIGGMLSVGLSRRPLLACRVASMSVVIGSVLAAVPVMGVLLGQPALIWRHSWSLPMGDLALRLDPLAAWFIMPLLLVSALAAVYGAEYLRSSHSDRLGSAGFFFNLLVASMVAVILASDAVLFLIAWEVMSVSSFFLVTFEDERESVCEAGWIYLVATHLGTGFLLAFFVLMGRETGTMDMQRWAELGVGDPRLAGILFLLAVIGFGTKAGLMPFHVWLPEAHPAAPSHVSAVMSGIMIKTGVYGLVRVLGMLGEPSLWWGWTLVGAGLLSGVGGVLFALAQHDLKRLLAYSSVENVGLITVGLGFGLLGTATQNHLLTVLGFGGALAHVLNHALFKSLLFLGAGSVVHATGTRLLDELGGLSKRMPWTATVFVIGAVAICGLPPLNGFLSELLLVLGAFRAVMGEPVSVVAAGVLGVGSIALISGLSAATFSKAFGMVFLGEARQPLSHPAHEPGAGMRWPMGVLAAACITVGVMPGLMLRPLDSVLISLGPLTGRHGVSPVFEGWGMWLTVSALILLGLVAVLLVLRRRLLAGRPVTQALTWDCGYARPTVRMQYTASSFVQPITALFSPLLRARAKLVRPDGLFPGRAAMVTETPDLAHSELYQPVGQRLAAHLARLRWMQQGKVQLYVLYVAVTMLVLLLWKLR